MREPVRRWSASAQVGLRADQSTRTRTASAGTAVGASTLASSTPATLAVDSIRLYIIRSVTAAATFIWATSVPTRVGGWARGGPTPAEVASVRGPRLPKDGRRRRPSGASAGAVAGERARPALELMYASAVDWIGNVVALRRWMAHAEAVGERLGGMGVRPMGIGPEASRMASGRLVTLGTVLGLVGGLCVLLGAGPLVTEADGVSRGAGLMAILGGGTMVSGAWGLLRRPTWGRQAGMIAAAVLALVGLALTYAAAETFVTSCAAVDGGTGAAAACGFAAMAATVGVALVLVGITGVRMIRRARRSYFGPRGGRRRASRDRG